MERCVSLGFSGRSCGLYRGLMLAPLGPGAGFPILNPRGREMSLLQSGCPSLTFGTSVSSSSHQGHQLFLQSCIVWFMSLSSQLAASESLQKVHLLHIQSCLAAPSRPFSSPGPLLPGASPLSGSAHPHAFARPTFLGIIPTTRSAIILITHPTTFGDSPQPVKQSPRPSP